MKTKFILLFFLFIPFHHLSFSQETPDDIVNRVNRATYIFEGRVIRSDSYWDQAQRQIYTSSTIEISKIAKGNLICGTVEIITVGGRVGDTEIRISHNLALTRGMMGVFLCDENIWDPPVIDYYQETNSNALWVPDGLEGFIRYYNDGINYAVEDWQFSLDSLAQLYNMMDLFTTLNLVDCGGALPFHNPPPVLPSLSAPVYPNHIIPVAQHASPFASSTSTEIHIDYLNRHITNTTPKYFEFDVSLTDDVDTGYFYSGEFAIDYPTTVFGTNIVAGTGVIVTTTGNFAGSSAYTLNPFDDPGNSGRLIMQIAPNTASFDPLLNLPDAGPVLIPAIHIRMKIIDCFPFGTIGMSAYLPFVHPAWSDSPNYGSGTTTDYSLSYFSTTLYFPSCRIHVDNISATTAPITGGTGDTVTIEGFNFDTARGNGNVWMRTANDNGSYIHLDSIDYISWNDSVIKFIMPGDGIYIDTTGSFGVAGSGKIKVQNNIGDTTLTDSTTVWYSIAQAYDSITNTKLMYNVGNAVPFVTDAYHFRIDTAFTQSIHPDRWNVIDVAIKQWVCLSGVNFVLGDTMTPPDTLAVVDNICNIQFGRTTSRSTLAQATQRKAYYACSGNPKMVAAEIDLVIDKNRKDSLFWDTNCHHDVPVGKYDIYSAILHELGHGHSLNHVDDWRNIMYWLDRGRYGIPASSRNIFIKFDIPAFDAANYVMSKRNDPNLLVCNPTIELPLRTIPDCDSLPRIAGCGPIWVEEIGKAFTDVKVFPNPANNNITLQMNSDDFGDANVEVVNIFGQTVQSKKEKIYMGINQLSVNIANLPSGIYCIGIKTECGRIFSQFIKQ